MKVKILQCNKVFKFIEKKTFIKIHKLSEHPFEDSERAFISEQMP